MLTRLEPHQLQDFPAPEVMALDTETSGLYTDAGARVAAVSVAWLDPDKEWAHLVHPGQHVWPGGIVTYLPEKQANGEPLWVLSLAWPFDQGVDGTGKAEDDGQVPLWNSTENHGSKGLKLLQAWVEQNDVKLVEHHGKFDTHILSTGFRGEEADTRWEKAVDQLYWDTQNVTSLIWGMHGTTALKPTAQRVFNEHVQDEQKTVKNYLAKQKLPTGRYDLVPWDVIAKYADLDARLTIRLYHEQLRELENSTEREKLQGLLDRRLATTKMLFRMEKRGLPFDGALARKESHKLKKTSEQLRQKLPFTPATVPTAKHYWFGEGTKNGVTGQGLEPEQVTDQGAPKLDATVVRELVRKNVEGAREWSEYNKALTADSRWYQGYADLAGPDGRLRGTVRQNGTRSGRFSIERVQLQAIPQDYRLEGFEVLEGVTRPRSLIGAGVAQGHALWELDLANAELRVAAQYAGCRRMLELIHEGADLHGETARELFERDDQDPEWKKYRTIAKRANFSLIFGVGWAKLQDDIFTQTGVAMSDYEARELVTSWNGLYPEYKRAINKTMWKVEERQRRYGYGWVTMQNGEKRWFTETEDTHKAFNQRVQGNLAQFGIDWWLKSDVKITEGLAKAGYDSSGPEGLGLVMLIHDSVVLLLPRSGRPGAKLKTEVDEKVVYRVKEIGESLWEDWFPGVPGGVDPEVWSRPE